MLEPQNPPAPATGRVEHPWIPFRPTPEAPWNLRRVVHLHRCAGFAATWEELQRDLREGPEASINRLLDGRSRIGVAAEFESLSETIADAAVDSREPDRLKAWWVFRMLLGPDPLGERLTLMWHNHFATSNQKVNDLAAMRNQNDLFLRLARAPFGQLLNAAVRDPALLLYLDAPANRKVHPNENLARELMELFTLGAGHFTEADVKEAARALTGWTVVKGSFFENAAAHDAGEKTLLGATGAWNGADLIQRLFDHPATAHRLAFRLCELLLGEGTVNKEDVASLAEGLRDHGLDVSWALANVLRSRAFFAEADLGTRVVGPVEFVVGAARALGCVDPPPSTLLLAEWITRMGQDLFYPPNVSGWPGGRSWLNSRALVARANFATALVDGRDVGLPGPVDLLGPAEQAGQSGGLGRIVAFAAELLLGAKPGSAWRDAIVESIGDRPTSAAQAARQAVALILTSPEFQVT